MNKLFTAAIMAFALSSAFAADPFTDAAQKAYAPYRVALFKTNSNSQAEALEAIDKVQAAWKDVIARFANKAPAPYDSDTGFAKSLDEVNKVYAKASAEIGKGELKAAHETLENARDILADLRHRNQVVVLSDHMNAYHHVMETILGEGEKTLASTDGRQKLIEEFGSLSYLARKLATEAPKELASNPEFIALNKALMQSVSDLRAALYRGDDAAVKVAIGKLKAPYSKFFLKFG